MILRQFAITQFHLAVALSVLSGFAVISDPNLILPDEEGLFGPLRNNLLIVVGYLLVGQLGLWVVRYIKGGYFEALIMGYSFAATAFGAKIYADVNSLPIANTFSLALGYFALAHGLYYFLGKPDEQNQKPTAADH